MYFFLVKGFKDHGIASYCNLVGITLWQTPEDTITGGTPNPCLESKDFLFFPLFSSPEPKAHR